MHRRPRLLLLALAIAASVAFGCATAPSFERLPPAEVAAFGRAAQVVLVLPLNVAVAMPAGLEGPSLAVSTELENHLADFDKRMKTISYQDARRLWLASVARARHSEEGEADGFAAAARLMTRELRRITEFDTLIAPSIFVQQAPVHGMWAAWDGVRRRIEIRRTHGTIRPGTLRASETAQCASIHVAVFDAAGREIHEGQGGLDVLVRVQMDEGFTEGLVSSSFRYFERRPEIFDDPALLREGVAKALDPFLPAEIVQREPL